MVTRDYLFGWAPNCERLHANTGATLNPIFYEFCRYCIVP